MLTIDGYQIPRILASLMEVNNCSDERMKVLALGFIAEGLQDLARAVEDLRQDLKARQGEP
jgi:hypothetical protein